VGLVAKAIIAYLNPGGGKRLVRLTDRDTPLGRLSEDRGECGYEDA